MLKIAYFDATFGISGDMFLGALLDFGLSESYLRENIKKLPIDGVDFKVVEGKRGGISGKRIEVFGGKKEERSFSDIKTLIEKSDLLKETKSLSIKIFENLAKAEAKIHGQNVEDVHFHEIGATDSIVDIVGASIGLTYFKFDQIFCSPLPFFFGQIDSSHGKLPLPAPATAELIKEFKVYPFLFPYELVTPTGAAIVKSVCQGIYDMPSFFVENIGYGIGSKDFKEFPNIFRIISGTCELEKDRVVVIETNIDDLNPEIFGHLFEKLFEKGCLDVYVSPIIMKKSRPGFLLSCICKENEREKIVEEIFRETSTIGVRFTHMERRKLKREEIKVTTKFGDVKAKVIFGPSGKKVVPEYEELKKIADEKNIPLKDLYSLFYSGL